MYWVILVFLVFLIVLVVLVAVLFLVFLSLLLVIFLLGGCTGRVYREKQWPIAESSERLL